MSDLKQQFAQDLASIDWKDLQPHALRDGIIIVDPNLNIIDVGYAVANDDTMSIQHWISEQLIRKPTSDELGRWNSKPGTQFNTLIVQPFVLISPV